MVAKATFLYFPSLNESLSQAAFLMRLSLSLPQILQEVAVEAYISLRFVVTRRAHGE